MSITIPTKIPVPFGYAAGAGEITTPIPTASQIGVVNGRASLHDGFPPDTFLPLTMGGVPPFGADFNGILNEITSITQWQQAGGFFPYDSAFSSAISGYPIGAVIQAANYQGFWVSTTDGNTTNPDTGGAGWTSLVFEGLQAITVTTANVTVSQLQSAYPILVISGALTGARSLILPAVVGQWIIQNNTTGAFTLTVKTAAGTGVVATQGQSTYLYGNGTNIYFASSVGVQSFNTRTGTVTLNATDVTDALGYFPANIDSPIFTGVPAAATATVGTNTAQLATTAFVQSSWFVSGTRMPFAQAAAPTGWTQDTSDNANNRMLRVVNTTGNGIGGTDSPILNNTSIPAHTHTFTGTAHNHGITDPGHSHSYTSYSTFLPQSGSSTPCWYSTAAATTGASVTSIGINNTTATGTNSIVAAVSWSPRYINMIICAKN